MSNVEAPEKARAIVIGHANFSAGLISAVGQICGMGRRLAGLSIAGMTPQDIEGAIREQLAETGAHVVFTDLPAGSATIAARRIAKEDPSLVVVSGVNLAALLDFVFSSASSDSEAAESAALRGRASLNVIERT